MKQILSPILLDRENAEKKTECGRFQTYRTDAGAAMHEYLKRIFKALEQGNLGAQDMAAINVAHDDRCGIYSGKPCNCDPDITIQTAQGVAHVLVDGTIEHEATH